MAPCDEVLTRSESYWVCVRACVCVSNCMWRRELNEAIWRRFGMLCRRKKIWVLKTFCVRIVIFFITFHYLSGVKVCD